MVARAKLVINGTLGNPAVERWSCGLHFGPGAVALPNTSVLLQTWVNAVAASLSALGSGTIPRSILSSAGTLTDVAAYYYTGPGPATLSANAPLSPTISGSGTPSMPPQASTVVTLLTDLAGRRNRGRIYWPRLTGTMTSTLKVTTGSGTATDFRDMLRALQSDGTTTGAYTLSVYSAAAETLTPVSRISIGDVVDTQRRRRDALQELRVVATM